MSKSIELDSNYRKLPSREDPGDAIMSATPAIRSTLLLSSSTLSQLNVNNQVGTEATVADAANRQQEESEETAIRDSSTPILATSAASQSRTEASESTRLGQKSFIKKAKRITQAARIKNIKQAATAIADFIPVVGNSGASIHRSRLHQSRRPLESATAHELEGHPLHKACALSASSASSSTRALGGNLSTIKALVEEEPELLHEQLPISGDTPLHIAVRFGAMQWHHMQDYPGGTSNLPIIEYLIQADVDQERKKAVRARKQSGTKTPISLASLISDSAMYKKDALSGDLPLHLAAAEGYEGAAMTLLN